MKWVVLTGFLVLLGRSDGSVLRCSTDGTDAPCLSDKEKGPSQEVVEETPALECLPGSEWESNCHYCRCSDGGTALCHKAASCEDTPFVSQKAEQPLPVGKECAAGSSWKNSCQTCVCSELGYSSCNATACVGHNEAAYSCAPLSTWTDECNTCWCSPHGIATCTKIGCERFGLDPENDSIKKVEGVIADAVLENTIDNSEEALENTNTAEQPIEEQSSQTTLEKRLAVLTFPTPNTAKRPEEQTDQAPEVQYSPTSYTLARTPEVQSPPSHTPAKTLEEHSFPDHIAAKTLEEHSSPSHTQARTLEEHSSPSHTQARTLEEHSSPTHTPAKTLKEHSSPSQTQAKTLGNHSSPSHIQANTLEQHSSPSHTISKRSVCKPNQQFQNECNSCQCAADGETYSCTQAECLERDMTKEVEVFMESEGVDHIERHSVCKPADTFYIGCNTCNCNADGTDYSCTNQPCPLPDDVELFHELREMKPIVPVKSESLGAEDGQTKPPRR